jgi:hypothetical protein
VTEPVEESGSWESSGWGSPAAAASAVKPAEQVPIHFAGTGAGITELTWGQRELWAAVELAGRWIVLGGWMPVPEGTTVASLARLMRFVMSRHQSLRTRFACDERGRPVQQVIPAAGETVLDVFDVDGGDDPQAFAEAQRARYENDDFDYETDWPIRMAAIRQGGAVTHAVVSYNHLVLDGFGLDALTRDLANLDPLTGAELAPAEGIQPLEQARFQASPAGRERSQAAMRYWDRHLREIPASRFPVSTDPRTPRYWQLGLSSPAMYLAARAVSARTSIETSAVLLGAYAVSLGRLSGHGRTAIRAVVSNRFRPGFGESVSVVNQTGLCVVDVGGVSIDEAMLSAWQASIAAGLRAYYDPRDLTELIARVSRERGEPLDVGCFFNDRRRDRGLAPAESVEAVDAIRGALPATRLRWDFQHDSPNERLFIHINDVPDRIDFIMCCDTHAVSPAGLEAVARGMESVLVEAALDPAARTGV